MPPAPTATAGLAKLLDGTRVGRFKVPISQLSHTTSGRPLHASGVTTLVASMRDNGWLASPMTVCLIGAQPEDGLQQNIAGDHQYEMVNGNHRLAALKRLEADPDFESPTDIEVEVHTGMDADTQRLVASSLNSATEVLVKTTLSDRVRWYRQFHTQIQDSKPARAKTPYSVNSVANKLAAIGKKNGVACGSMPTIKSFLHIVTAMKPRAIAALHDITHVPGRPDGHIDLKDGSLKHSRVTQRSLQRAEFAALTDTQQEAYIYRLASGGDFAGVMTDDNFKKLDEHSASVALMVDSAETNFGPTTAWTDGFKWLVAKSRNYELQSKFVTHFNSRAKAAADYKLKLPDGMKSDTDYESWIKSQPWPPLLAYLKGSEEKPSEMQGVYDKYIKARDDKKAAATAAEGRWKTKIAAEEKAATDAAAADAAAKEAAAAVVAATARAAATAAQAAKTAGDAAAAPPAAEPEPGKTPDLDPVSTPAAGTETGAAGGAADKAAGGAATGAPVSSAASSPSPAAGTEAGKSPSTLAGVKRKAASIEKATETAKRVRPLMTKLVSVDLLGKGTLDTETEIQHPAGRPFMLAFVNIAADRSTLTSDGSVLKAALTFLCNNLHSRGTVVVALPDWEFNRTTLKALFSDAGLTLEESPVVSLYLHGKSGRPAEKDRFVYPSQGSVTLLAHKSINFICNGGGPRSRGGETASRAAARGVRAIAPRTLELDKIGAVVSYNHPNSGTFLSDATAELLVRRFSDVGDAVLVSGGSRDSSLAALVLNEGRTLIALEPEVAKINATSETLDALTVAAAKIGMWSRMLAGPVVTVGPNRLPIKVPPSNVAATRTEEAIRAAVDSGEVENPEMKVAMGDAQAHGIEIRDSTIHGKGLFTSKSFDGTPGSFIQLPLVGSFEVQDSYEDAVEATIEDGLPRFLVSENMSMFLSAGEVARPNAGLYLVPHKTSPLFYMNSSSRKAELENFSFESVLKPREFKGMEEEDRLEFLRKSPNSVLFDLTARVERDTELFAYYRFEKASPEV